jgi:hypothetical protein
MKVTVCKSTQLEWGGGGSEVGFMLCISGSIEGENKRYLCGILHYCNYLLKLTDFDTANMYLHN